MTASSTSRHRPDDTPCRVEAAASLARATRSPIHLARSVHPANLMALRPQLRFARSAPAIPPSQPRPTRPTPPARAPEARPHHESPQRPVRATHGGSSLDLWRIAANAPNRSGRGRRDRRHLKVLRAPGQPRRCPLPDAAPQSRSLGCRVGAVVRRRRRPFELVAGSTVGMPPGHERRRPGVLGPFYLPTQRWTAVPLYIRWLSPPGADLVRRSTGTNRRH